MLLPLVEFEVGGVRQIQAFDTVGAGGRRSEFIARDALPEGATLNRLSTERAPCRLSITNCPRMLDRDFPSAEISYLVEYGDAASRARGNAALDQILRAVGL